MGGDSNIPYQRHISKKDDPMAQIVGRPNPSWRFSSQPSRMAFHITRRYGAMEKDPPLSALPALLRELDNRPEDTEHGSVALSHESEWCLTVSREGYVIFEHLENGGERHMRGVSETKIIELWSRLAQGDIASIECEPWTLGYK